MEVNWNAERRSLYGPPPPNWTHARWLRQILDAARKQGCELAIADETEWVHIAPSVQAAMLHEIGRWGGAR
ncbi:MAG: hypothetical protein IAE99_05590 [Rhodothermales bacterium]|nr:hypothetical protein [Rhodothermales bacterium]